MRVLGVSQVLRGPRRVLEFPGGSPERVPWGPSRTQPQNPPWNLPRDHLGVPREGGRVLEEVTLGWRGGVNIIIRVK